MCVCWIRNYLKDIRKKQSWAHSKIFLSATFTFRYYFGGYGRIKGEEGNLEMPTEYKRKDTSVIALKINCKYWEDKKIHLV